MGMTRLFSIILLHLIVHRSEAFLWYEKNYTKAEAASLLATADGYWSMDDDLNAAGALTSSSLVQGPVNKALRTASSPHILSTAIPACMVNSEACTGDVTGFTISLWYSLRPDGGLNYDNNQCLLLTVGEQTQKQIKIKFEGGPEHNISFTVPHNSSHDASVHIWASNMTDPRYNVCNNSDFTTNTCAANDITRIGWQWNQVALVNSNTSGLKAYYNTYELSNVVLNTRLNTQLYDVTTDTELSLYPNGGCNTVGFDEVAYWTKALTQEDIAALRLGPFGTNGTTIVTTKKTTTDPVVTSEAISTDSSTTINAVSETTGTLTHQSESTQIASTASESIKSTAVSSTEMGMTSDAAIKTTQASTPDDSVTSKRVSRSTTLTSTKSTTQIRTVNVVQKLNNVKGLAQAINASTTASKAQTVLQDVQSIITSVASNQIDTDEESDITEDIVSASVTITKTVAESAIFMDTATTSEEKMNVRQQCLETLEVSSTLASQISYTNSSQKTAAALQIEEAMTSLLETYLNDPTVPTAESVTTSNLKMKFKKIDTSSGEPIKLDFTSGGGVEIKSDQYTAGM
ncbi:uncharacterized protein [Amphiura filiformis]|uniref:uncharacterized protein n=1 Tax=Amphiura filiformis TaxID=82378 RepID=UPI003B21D639